MDLSRSQTCSILALFTNSLVFCFVFFFVAASPCPGVNVDPDSGVCFYVASSSLYTYSTAQTACSDINMDIAVVDTAEKHTFIESIGILDDAGKYVISLLYLRFLKENYFIPLCVCVCVSV